MSDKAQWHWAEGMKYALETVRTATVLNSGATLALLTFYGNNLSTISTSKRPDILLALSLLSFALGAAFSGLTLAGCYLAQLWYGNAETHPKPSPERDKDWSKAKFWHNGTYALAGLSFLFFLAGIFLSAAYFISHT